MNAETAYLFRHALVRDAAYELQMPSDRAALHEIAFRILEDAFRGCPPTPAPLAEHKAGALDPHPTDPVARELAYHARLAGEYWAESEMKERHLLYLRRAAEHCERNYHSVESIRCWEQLSNLLTDDANRGLALLRAARLCGQSGRMDDAERLFAIAQTLLHDAGDRRAELIALGGLANVYRSTARLHDAEATLLQVLAIHRELGNRKDEGSVLNNLANVYMDTDRKDLAEAAFQNALVIARETDNRPSEGFALGNLGVVYQDSGRHDEAERALTEALAIHREVKNRASEGVVLGNLAILYRHIDRLDDAKEQFEAALAIHREVSNRFFEAAHSGEYAMLLLASGQRESARKQWSHSTTMLGIMGADAIIDQQRSEMAQICERLDIEPLTKDAK